MKKIYIFWLFVLASNFVLADVLTGTDELAQMPFWELRSESMSFRLVQRLPDQTRAYFSGRGFNKELTDYIAGYCFFQTVFKNTAIADSNDVIQYDASQWQLSVNDDQLKGSSGSLMLREKWPEVWKQHPAKQPQRIALEWSLLPSRQQYQPADYNWGMTAYKVPHGAVFDLTLRWKLNGQEKTETIHSVQCAKDVYIPPAEQ